MYNFPAIYIANGTAVLLLLVVMLSIRKPLHHGLFEEKMYYAMIVINIMQCILEVVTFLLNGKIEYRTLTVVLNVLLFSNSLIFSFFWTIYADYKLFADMRRIRRIYPFIAIPAVLMIIGCFINLVTPVFFVIDEYNVYQRTDLFFLTYVVTYSYLVYGVVLISMYRKKVHKYLFLPAIIFMIPIFIGSLLQFLFYGYSLVWLGVAVGMTSLFINVQNEASYVDILSGVFNRQYLNNMFLMYSKRWDAASVPAGIMLDFDNFKSINDKFGHLVGDDVISATGKILRAAVSTKGIICRYGGDEFIILMYVNSKHEIMEMIDAVKTQTNLFNESEKKPYKINFSIGYSTFDINHDSIDDFLKRADASMYEEKKRKIAERIIADRRNN